MSRPAIASGDDDRTGAPMLPNPNTTPTITVDVAAPILGVSVWAAYQAIKHDTFPVAVLRVGRCIRVPTKPLLDALGLGGS